MTTTRDRAGERAERRGQRYDPAGNLLESATGLTYAYDAANRPTRETATDGTIIETAYWADGQRRERTAGDASTTFYWDGATLVNDVHRGGDRADDAPSGVAAYLIGERRHARTTVDASGGVVTSHYGLDRHRNVTELTSDDGVVIERNVYTDYGVRTTTRSAPFEPPRIGAVEANPFGYSGEYHDTSGAQHLQARSYDPLTARFISMDREELHNRYAFADLNPIMRIDPSGRASLGDVRLDVTRQVFHWFGALLVLAQIATVAGWMTGGLTTVPAIALAAIGWLVQATALAGVVANTVEIYSPQPIYNDGGGMYWGFGIGSVFVATFGGMIVGQAVQMSVVAAATRALAAGAQAGRGTGTIFNFGNGNVQTRADFTPYGSAATNDVHVPAAALSTSF